MLRRVLLLLILAVVVATAAAVSYAVLRLPESGDVQRPALSFIAWAEENGRPTETITAECQAVNETTDGRQACFIQLIEEAQTQWRESRFGTDDLWTASELSTKRNAYLGVGAVILLALGVGLLAVRVMTQHRGHSLTSL